MIGNGNVAIDVARLLTKPASALAVTDMSHAAVEVLSRSRTRKVVLAGRRGPLDARFSVKELEELGDVADVSVALAEGVAFPGVAEIDVMPAAQSSMLHALARYAANRTSGKSRQIEFQFLARPAEIVGRERVEALRFERMWLDGSCVHGTARFFDVPCGAVVTCIGYRARPLETLSIDSGRGGFTHDEALIGAGLYCTGWARRGPSGTIATNRSDATQVAQRLSREVQDGGTAGPAALDLVLAQRGVRPVSLVDWRTIDRAECSRAAAGAPRRKFHNVAEMLELLDAGQACLADA